MNCHNRNRLAAGFAMVVAFFGFSHVAFAYTANYWRPVDGEWNGNWSDEAHWSLGHVPSNAKYGEDAVIKNTSGHEIVITVDKDFVSEGDDQAIPAFIKIGDSDSEPVLAPVRLDGSGKLTMSAPSSIY